MATTKQTLNDLQQKALTAFNALSSREKTLVLGTAIFLVLFIAGLGVSSIVDLFSTQETRIVALERNFSSAVDALDRYDKLVTRLKGLQKNFQKDGPSGGVRSYLEQAVTTRAGVSAPEFSIKPGVPRPLGENYSQSPYSISFRTTSISKIVDFLRDLTSPESSLLLTRLEIVKGRNAEILGVTVDVSSVTSVQK